MNKILILIALLIGCGQAKQTDLPKTIVKRELDIQGHRGCRGLMPENTLPAFVRAIELGVTTLEMDLVISADAQVVVSHEPFFRAGIALDPDGTPIDHLTEHDHNIYEMSYDQVKTYELGTLPDSNHLYRTNIATYKPLFSEVVNMAKAFCTQHDRRLPYFNVEIKSKEAYDGKYHPDIRTFTQLVIDQIDSLQIQQETCIQSFDLRALRMTKELAPNLSTALLIMNEKSADQNIQELGFKPDIYSCYYRLVDEELIDYCRENRIKVIPWTVNHQSDMESMIEIGVDGIISDYPDLLIETYANYAAH